jgi:uncharacterized protein YaeQ
MLSSVAAPTQFRIALSHVDRAIDRVRSIIVERHRLETAEHLILRVLAWCLFYDDELGFGAGMEARGAADLSAHDPTGKTTIWVECGDANAEELRKVVRHSRGVALHVLFNDRARRDELLAELAAITDRPAELDAMGIWYVDPALVAELAARDEQRQRWAVTIVGDHLYVECDGLSVDSELERSTPPPERR